MAKTTKKLPGNVMKLRSIDKAPVVKESSVGADTLVHGFPPSMKKNVSRIGLCMVLLKWSSDTRRKCVLFTQTGGTELIDYTF